MSYNLTRNIWNFFMFQPSFYSSQVKWRKIIRNKSWMYELPHEFLNGLKETQTLKIY